MSTKIYDAYRIPRTVDIFEFQARARELADPVRARLDAEEIVTRAEKAAVERMFFGADETLEGNADLVATGSPVAYACHRYMCEQMDEKPSSVFHDPHRFEMSFVPHGNWIGVKAFTSVRDWDPVMEQLVEEFGGHEYHYQNQVDMPENVSEAEWDERRDFWDEAVGDDTWVERGLSFQHKPESHSTLVFPDDVRKGSDDSMLLDGKRLALALAIRLVLKPVFGESEFRASTFVKLERFVRQEGPLRGAIEQALTAITLDSLFHPLPVPEKPLLTDEIQEMATKVARRFLDEDH